jgi:hypothetical protein
MDCTANHHRGARLRRLGSVLAVVVVCALTVGSLPGVARADGDPASDVLATQSVFLPQDAGMPLAQQRQLSGLLSSAASSGYPIRVALIASSSDLGSVTELWRQPQPYAQFLEQELSLVYHGPVLVVMPNGFGLYGGASSGVPVSRSTLAGIRIAAGGAGLGAAALSAVQGLAAAAGHSLTVPPASAGPSGSSSTNPLPAVAFAIGLVLIALAWGASLRARPPRLRGRRAVN